MTPDIYLAFRFHGNFYHSYRGDTPDELGFGKDIRVIRHLIAALDALNARGIPVRGTWDFENRFSLQSIMPEHCPEIIEGLQRRMHEAGDEAELMSYNNGLIAAHTAREFEEAVGRGVANEGGSGLRDLFGGGFWPMVRPQEMMYTPAHLKLYRACGIDAISLYYSALPFNGFSNFVPPLSIAERYNPLTLTYPGIDETMTLLPCYSVGDLADHLTLRRWVKQMRRQQVALEDAPDLLLLIDMDADDEFWVGYDVPLLKGHFSTASGLRGLVENVADLDYVRFTTPGAYLDGHEPVGSITIGQDTADGSFDGYSSWAEKWSNHRMWTGLERARILELQARRLPHSIQRLLDESFQARLLVLSTTHFGMATPVMNVTRERIGAELVCQAVDRAAEAFSQAAPALGAGQFSLLDYLRGVSTGAISYSAHRSSALVRLALQEAAPDVFDVRDGSGRLVPSATLRNGGGRELLLVERFEPGERKDYLVEAGQAAAAARSPVLVTDRSLENEFVRLDFDGQGQLTRLRCDGMEFASNRLLFSGLSYGGKAYEVEEWSTAESLALGIAGVKRSEGRLLLKGGHEVRFEREILLAAGLPYIYAGMRVVFPRTHDRGYDRGKARRLEQAWDNAWEEIRACEIAPALVGGTQSPLRVWKHNYCDHVSSFSLDYGRYSGNDQLDSVNNHVTDAWVAVSDGRRGLLVAQCADVASNMAFCPLRTRMRGGAQTVRLNPFGTYWGKQYRYPTADTGLGRLMAITFSASDHINSYAPSYNGRVHEFRLLIAPYEGDAPPEQVRHDAEAFAYPYLVLGDEEFIAPPAHRRWDDRGLGQPPRDGTS